MRYHDEQFRECERTIWPATFGYAEAMRLLAARCELKDAVEFREKLHGFRLGEPRTQRRRVEGPPRHRLVIAAAPGADAANTKI
jgi:hypothetical protein